jgi:hypothetical protein
MKAAIGLGGSVRNDMRQADMGLIMIVKLWAGMAERG